jgi:hypothetical protein
MCLQAHDLLSGVLDRAHKLLSADLDIYKPTKALITSNYSICSRKRAAIAIRVRNNLPASVAA